MRSYDFAPIAAREYPTLKMLDHPYIWGGVRYCINVSEKPYSPELEKAMKERGIEWLYCPLSEEMPSCPDWTGPIYYAVAELCQAYEEGKKMVVHCDFGNNRSRTLIEAFYYRLFGEHLKDEYKGEINHIVYNSKVGHLPPVEDLEKDLLSLCIRPAENSKTK